LIVPVIPRARIIVVDAHPSDYDLLAHDRTLIRLQFDFFSDGRSLFRDRQTTSPELVIINMNLPDMSGLDVYQVVFQRWPEIPVYFVGDDYRPDDEIKARTSGAIFYFCKPLQSEWLIAAKGLCA
jgi:DNA-binding response OmpR family regulator